MVEKKGRGGGESSSLQRWKKVAKVAREEKTREAETKLDSRKRLVSNYPRSRASRATDVAKHAHCKRYDCANTASIPSSNYSRKPFLSCDQF